ncbi:hypothetical protein Taro_048059 [Colocasia esculenta]|uniref:NmrA-like domain-containing protein n=1 Tax=Colocasia esculenta TaxID=4460 RepID=A0A843X836_COLES|nr:hypothetical protein [Colocasia esculenta]
MLLSFKAQGARLVESSFSDHGSLVDTVKQVDVVICAMSGVHFRSHNLLLQLKLVDAIKEAGNVTRFLRSEFGMDPTRMGDEPGRVSFDEKMTVRKAIKDAGIPHTYVSANCFADYFGQSPVLQEKGPTRRAWVTVWAAPAETDDLRALSPSGLCSIGPASLPVASPPMDDVLLSLRQLHLGEAKSVRSSWGLQANAAVGSPRGLSVRPGFCSVPTTLTSAVVARGGLFDGWEAPAEGGVREGAEG